MTYLRSSLLIAVMLISISLQAQKETYFLYSHVQLKGGCSDFQLIDADEIVIDKKDLVKKEAELKEKFKINYKDNKAYFDAKIELVKPKEVIIYFKGTKEKDENNCKTITIYGKEVEANLEIAMRSFELTKKTNKKTTFTVIRVWPEAARLAYKEKGY